MMVKQLTSNSHMSAHILRRYFRPHTATQNKKEEGKIFFFLLFLFWRGVFYLLVNWKSLGWEQRFESIQLGFVFIVWWRLSWPRAWLTSSNHSVVLLSSFRWKLFILLTWTRFILQNPHSLESFFKRNYSNSSLRKQVYDQCHEFSLILCREPNCTIEYESHHHSPSYYEKKYKSVLIFFLIVIFSWSWNHW